MRRLFVCSLLLFTGVGNSYLYAATETDLYNDAIKCSVTAIILLNLVESNNKRPNYEEKKQNVQKWLSKSTRIAIERGHRLRKTDDDIRKDIINQKDIFISDKTSQQIVDSLDPDGARCIELSLF